MTSSPDARHNNRRQTTLWLAGGLAMFALRELRTRYLACRVDRGA